MIRIALAALALAASTAYAQPAPKAPVVQSAANQLLADVEANYKKPQHLSASFEQTVSNVISGTQAPALGTFRVEKPDKLRFDFMQPKVQPSKLKVTYLFDGKSMWMLDFKNMRFGERGGTTSELPSLVAFFLGAGTLSREFTPVLGKTGELELTPKKPNAAYAKIVLVLDAKRMVTQTTIVDSSGNTQAMKFIGVTLDKPAPSGTFVLDKKTIAGWGRLK